MNIKQWILGAAILGGFGLNEASAQTKLLKEMDSVSYAIGLTFAQNINQTLKSNNIENTNQAALLQGLTDVLKNQKTLLTEQQANAVVQKYIQYLQTKKYEAIVQKGRTFLENNKKQAGVVALPSGLQFKIITEGTGAIPKQTDKVNVHYQGSLLDGRVFDSSIQRGTPLELNVNGVIQGWQEALQMMKVGSKWQLFIPYNLAYGERGAGEMIGPYETLIFDVELLGSSIIPINLCPPTRHSARRVWI
jgi:FKBP-type peptidyl-prolyl cis-trans isomerase FklB